MWNVWVLVGVLEVGVICANMKVVSFLRLFVLSSLALLWILQLGEFRRSHSVVQIILRRSGEWLSHLIKNIINHFSLIGPGAGRFHGVHGDIHSPLW